MKEPPRNEMTTGTPPPKNQPPRPGVTNGWAIEAEGWQRQLAAAKGNPELEVRILELMSARASHHAGVAAVSSPAMAPIAKCLPPPPGAGPRVQHPKILARDLRRTDVADHTGFMARVRAATKSRQDGDPLAGHIRAVAGSLVYFWTRRDRPTYEALATAAIVCRETVRRCIRWLERRELIDTVNVLARTLAGGIRTLLRVANLYLPVPPPAEAKSGPQEPQQERTPQERARVTISRWAAKFGLEMRPQGWNATRLRSGRT
jgi:hypothetical protein